MNETLEDLRKNAKKFNKYISMIQKPKGKKKN